MLAPWAALLRLTSLMLGGTLFGGVSFCFLFLKYRNIGYGYPNLGDWQLAGAMTGAILGIGAATICALYFGLATVLASGTYLWP